MKLTATYQIPASRERVFAALTDPAVLQRLIDGCESFVQRDDGVFEARLKVGVGSIKGTYTGHVRMQDVNPPESYTLLVDGRGTPGFVKGSANIRLIEHDGGTELTCDADVQVGGVIAAVGSRLIEAAARQMMDRFFANLARELSANASSPQ
jgi:carbon monoxide dehydrogenase subunit G